MLVVVFADFSDGSVVPVVRGLVVELLDVNVAVVFVDEAKEFARGRLEELGDALVARYALFFDLLQDNLGYDDVGEDGVLENVHLVKDYVGVGHDVVGLFE
jgi:hypothetical protein